MTPLAGLLAAALSAPTAAPDASAIGPSAPAAKWHRVSVGVEGHPAILAATETELIAAGAGPKIVEYRTETGAIVRTTQLRDCNEVTRMQVVADRLLYFCELWQSTPDDPMVITTPTGFLATQDLRNGRRLWKKAVATLTGSFVVTPQRVFMVDDTKLKSLAVTTGSLNWSATLPTSRQYALAAAGERVFVATDSGTLFAFNAVGAELWRQTLPAGRPTLQADDDIVVASLADRGDPGVDDDDKEVLRGYRAPSGALAWLDDEGASRCASPALAGKLLLVATEPRARSPGALRAIDLASGKQQWRAPLVVDCEGHDFTPQPRGDAVVAWTRVPPVEDQVADTLYGLMAFQLATGQELWQYRVPDQRDFILSAALWRDRIIAYTDGRQLRALALPEPTAPRTTMP